MYSFNNCLSCLLTTTGVTRPIIEVDDDISSISSDDSIATIDGGLQKPRQLFCIVLQLPFGVAEMMRNTVPLLCTKLRFAIITRIETTKEIRSFNAIKLD